MRLIGDKLKASLLQDAFQGKLTKQLPEDGDARDLLKEIQAEKERLVKEKKIKEEKPLPVIKDEEIPFDIPKNWVWTRLGEVTNYGECRQVNKHNIGSHELIIELEDIEKNSYKILHKKFDRIPGSNKNRFKKNDVLYGKLRPYLRKCVIVDCDGYCSTEIIPINGYGRIDQKFIMYYMTSPFVDIRVNSLTHGMDMPRLGTRAALKLLFPLPPLAEQRRIVDKLKTAIEKTDELKFFETKLSELEKSFPNKLKASLLQDAFQGKLTKQLPEDGDARDLLKEVQAEKERLVKEKKIKEEKPLPVIKDREIPFDIPRNWVWTRLGEISLIGSGITPDAKYLCTRDGIPYFKVSDMNSLGNETVMKVASCYVTKSDLWKTVPKNSVIYPKNGGALLTNKRRMTIDPCIIDLNTGYATPVLCHINYFYYWFLNIDFSHKCTGSAVPTIAASIIKKLLFPLPPLAEQRRIVDKLKTALEKIESLNDR
ncbi:restriction endonuclease subunit S [Bartonella apis]|uniref:Type I restriction enzyme, S subunit n=1 Tax=Bartonella apis TaxID=1686310 RepID=A0A1R0FAI2_9HYPH|nr:restriction endonuclease subunit S [Bartonella apis]OLY43912.1 type I restriction enzyme, S subunit [Bartonella apis]